MTRKQPTKKILLAEYELLKKSFKFKGRNTKGNPIIEVANSFGYHRQTLMHLMTGGVIKWREHHFKMYDELKKYLKAKK